MLNPSDLRGIIRDTLNAMNTGRHITEATIDLIQMTFFMETRGEFIFNEGYPEKHGFMQMTKQNVYDVVLDTIRPCDRFVEGLADACLVEARSDELEDLFVAASYNIALQVALTFYWYLKRCPEMPSNVSGAAEAYLAHWKMTHVNTRVRDDIVRQFLGYQKSTK